MSAQNIERQPTEHQEKVHQEEIRQAQSDEHNTTKIIIDRQNNLLRVNDDDERLDPLMMRLLVHFIERPEQLISRQDLSDEVWQRSHTSDEAINRGISRIRKLLGGKRNDFIQTVPKQGYVFTTPKYASFELTDVSKHNEKPVESEIDNDINKRIETNTTAPHAPEQGHVFVNHHSKGLRNNNIKLVLIATTLIITTLILAIITFQLTTSNNQSIYSPVLSKSTPKLLVIRTFSSQGNNQNRAQTLHHLLTIELGAQSKLKVVNRLDSEQSDQVKQQPFYIFDAQVSEKMQHLEVNLTLQSHDKSLNLVTTLTFDSSAKDFTTNDVIKELGALIRLMLVHDNSRINYMDALDPLTYSEVELLTLAKRYVTEKNSQSINFAYQKIHQLEKKYPSNDKVIGLLAVINRFRSNHIGVDVPIEKQQELKHALKALSINPQNYDGLSTAFLYYVDFAHIRTGASTYADILLQNYPHHVKSWRNQLYMQIINRKPCETIRQFMTNIPEGMFTKTRIKVIHQILDSCVSGDSQAPLFEQLKKSPNNMNKRALLNNTTLFLRRHDILRLNTDNFNVKFIGLRNYAHQLSIQLMRQDYINVLSTLEKIQNRNSQYWLWRAQSYVKLHQLPQLAEHDILQQDLWHDDFLNYLELDAEWYYAANLVKQLTTDPQNTDAIQRVNQYLTDRPAFSVEIINVKESIAKIMMLYHAGSVQQSKVAANMLYKQLGQNYQQSPHSFKFWHLGRYHLIAKLYCGQSCQNTSQSEALYLDTMFNTHHVWWLDNYDLIVQTLQPFKQNRLAMLYLDKIEQDRNRMQNDLGFKVD